MYSIQQFTPKLIYIQWERSPRATDAGIEEQFLIDLTQVLDKAPEPLYIISDLRQGRISSTKTLQRLAALTHHKNYKGSTAFSSNPVTKILVSTFARFSISHKPADEIWKTPEQALAYLE